MDKLTIATQVLLKLIETNKTGFDAGGIAAYSFEIADAMQAEAEKRNKAEAEQKRKEIREMLNDANTFIEREGQHFDDLTPTWDQWPNVLTAEDAEKYKNMIKREFDLYNNPQPKIEKRKSIHAEESDWQPDWSKAPSDAAAYIKLSDWDVGAWIDGFGIQIENAPSFGFTGTHIVERPHGK